MRGTQSGRRPSSAKSREAKETDCFIVLSRIVERLRGMKGISEENSHVVLVPCCDIHTFGMKAPIDVAFIDARGVVIAVHRHVVPGRRIRNASARLVVERFSHQGVWYERGDDLFKLPVYANKKVAEFSFDCQE